MAERDFQDLIDRLAAAATDAREAVREAHAARKDLDHARREAEAYINALVAKEYEEHVAPAVGEALAGLRDRIEATQTSKAQQIIQAFDRLTNTMLYGNVRGRGTSIADLPGVLPDTKRAFKKAEAEMKAPLE